MAMIKEEDCPKGLSAWLATFGDLMSLLLTFFVLLLSFSTMSVTSFQHAMGALQGALSVQRRDVRVNDLWHYYFSSAHRRLVPAGALVVALNHAV